MAKRLARLARPTDPAVIWATSPSLFVGLAGSTLARRLQCHFVWDLRDLTWSYLEEDTSGGFRSFTRHRAGAVLRQRAGFVARSAHAILTSNTGIKDAVLGLGVDPRRLLVAPNGVSTEILERGTHLGETPNLTRPIVTYAGAIGYYQGLESLLDVAELLPEVDIQLVGDGPMRAELEAQAHFRELANIRFTGYADQDRLFELYESSDPFRWP